MTKSLTRPRVFSPFQTSTPLLDRPVIFWSNFNQTRLEVSDVTNAGTPVHQASK